MAGGREWGGSRKLKGELRSPLEMKSVEILKRNREMA